jgi:transketolase
LIVRCARETGAVVCAEEHQIHGGAGSAVAEVLAWAGVGAPTEFTGVQDTFTETGDYDGLLKKYGLDAAAVAGAVRKAVARK